VVRRELFAFVGSALRFLDSIVVRISPPCFLLKVAKPWEIENPSEPEG